MKRLAKLRVCASCEWVFDDGITCPKCQFGSYGAYRTHGKQAYRFKITQRPWLSCKARRYIDYKLK